MENLYRKRQFYVEEEEETVHCALCGGALEGDERSYEWGGIPYCRTCMLDLPACELIRICEKDETRFFEGLGFTIHGRFPYAGF